MKPTVLIVDDDRSFRILTETALAGEGFDVRSAATLRKAREELDGGAPDVVILDRRMPDGDGIALLQELNATSSLVTPVIVVTAYGDIDSAVAAMQGGAVDYLTKPINVADLLIKIHKVLETRGLRDRLALANVASRKPTDVAPQSAALRRVHSELERLARSPQTPVLLLGQSGAGKQFAAELLHRLTYAEREAAPFVDVNCAALPEQLVESELFGHERGAFTDAKTTRRGLVEMAHGGTLFLDEVTELPEASQAKLLKFLDSGRFRRLGGQREIEVELRVTVATNRDIQELVERGRFREDLYHRLAVYVVRVPPLSERREDIPLLAKSFVDFFGKRVKKRITGISDGALAALSRYDFPGNVRELRNIIERAVILSPGPILEESAIVLSQPRLPNARPAGFFTVETSGDGSPPSLEEVERAYVARVLEHMSGRRLIAAQALGVSYPTFLKRLREFGMPENDHHAHRSEPPA
ncbi:MAG TPA: sigma-54 dependent transcriptional regulator [Polyangiaceae bacterium]|jgi:two-component system response regulator AtoC|nr:sigma-54 dependent transcriptional regulator [Polyangiaceae bacterium]